MRGCIHVEARGNTIVFLCHRRPFCLEAGSQLSCLPRELPVRTCLSSPLSAHFHKQLFYQLLGIQTQVLALAQQAFLPTEPSPSPWEYT